MKYPYNMTVMLLLAISAISYVIGVVNLPITGLLIWILAIIGIGIHVAMYIYTVLKISKLPK